MNHQLNRRRALRNVFTVLACAAGASIVKTAKAAKAAVQNVLVRPGFPKGYDPRKHRWVMAVDAGRCIGCGACVEACKAENHVPAGPYFRTWIERYILKKPAEGSGDARGETVVDSPQGGLHGFADQPVPASEIQHSFFVPKLCNLCEHSPCVQACPVGATFDTPDGAVLIDSKYCIGCGFCIQTCPYGCRFLNPITRTAEKCTLCYHRITRGLKPACVEVCPAEARVFGDLKNPDPEEPIQRFYRSHKLQALKPHLGTEPRLLYAGIDKEVR